MAINLRYPTGGETSATLMRLLGLGKPVVVSDHGSFAEVPDGCCAKLPLGEGETTILAGYLSAFADDADLRRRVGRNARHYMMEEHSLEGAADAYIAFLEQVAACGRSPFVAAPPLRAEPPSAWGEMTADVGSAIADLGVPDHDTLMLEEVAATIEGLVVAPVAEGRSTG